MKKFSPDEIRRARSAAAEISQLLESIAATDHPLEKEQQTDLLKTFITPEPGHSLNNLAHEIADNKIEATIEEFLIATQPFYFNAGIAKQAAESCETVAALHHLRREIIGSPSVDQAKRLLGLFNELLASPAAIAAAETDEANSAGFLADDVTLPHAYYKTEDAEGSGEVPPTEDATADDAGNHTNRNSSALTSPQSRETSIHPR